MLIVTPNLNYLGQCKEAIALYQQAFHAQVTCLIECEGDPDIVYHSEMLIGQSRIMLADRDPGEIAPGTAQSFVVTFESAPEVKAAFDILSVGARILQPMQSTSYSSCFVSLQDRFGIRWELMTEQTER